MGFLVSKMQKKGLSTGIIILIVIGILFAIIILTVGGYLLFHGFSNAPDSKVSSENQSSDSQIQGNFIDCGQIPSNFATEMGDDDASYFSNYPEVKESLECISDNLKECKPSKIKYLGDYEDNVFIVNKTEGNNCVVQYESGDKGVECIYTLEQTKMLYEVAEENGMPWATAYGISLGMGFEILRFSSGQTFEQEITNKNTMQKEKVYCRFFGDEIETCTEYWKCTNWLPVECPLSEIQERVCIDANNCGTTKSKPIENKECSFEYPKQFSILNNSWTRPNTECKQVYSSAENDWWNIGIKISNRKDLPINPEDWIIHEVDGVEFKVNWTVPGKETGFITKNVGVNYSRGSSHTIRLAIYPSDVKEITILCG
jgi:hypothetical protein